MTSGVAPTEDPFGGRSFVSPAKIRILLTPTGPDVSPVEFEQWCASVRSFENIRLADLPPSANSRAGPLPGSALHRFGEVHLSFVTSYDPSHSFLAPFALHRQVLGVLGLGSFSSSEDRANLEKAPSALRELHPNAIVHRAFIFDSQAGKDAESEPDREVQAGQGHTSEDEKQSDESSDVPASPATQPAEPAAGFSQVGNTGLVIFPAVRRDGKDVRFYLRTLLREFVGILLDGLWDIVKTLEGGPLETPRETLDGSLIPSSASSTQSSATTTGQSSSLSPTGSAASRASSFFSSFGASSSSSGTSGSSSPAAIGGGTQPAGVGVGASSGESKTPLSMSSASRSSKAKRTSSLVGAGPTGAGRYAKIRADYSLLSGDLWGAIGGYDTCMSWLGKERALAGGQDAVWYASALEGWAVTRSLIFRMSGLEEKGPSLSLPTGGSKEKDKKDKSASDSPFAKYEWADIAEAYSTALQIYSKTLAPPRYLAESVRSVTNETPRDYTHPLIHASACIAYARFLLAVWASSGWNAECFDQLIYGGVPPSLVEDARPGPAMYAALSKASGVERHEIAAPTSLALSHSVSALKPPDQISILCSLANIYGCVGFLRREAYLLRQLQASVVSLLARALILHPREPTTLTRILGQIRGSEHAVLGTLVSQTITSGLSEGADAVLILALQICETYGINVDVEPLKNIPLHHILSRAAMTGKTTATGEPLLKRSERANRGTTSGTQSQDASRSDTLSREDSLFGWADLQVALLKDTICVAEMLQDHVSMAFFAAILVRDYHEILSGEEQQSLIRGLMRCVTTARWRDARELEVFYWGPSEPLASLELETLSPARNTTERPGTELLEATINVGGTSSEVPGLKNPFFWNTQRSSGGQSKQTTLVQGEKVSVTVTLQNPFKTALDASDMWLSTSGARFEADHIAVTLPPSSYHIVTLTGTPQEVGDLKIRGIHMTLSGCQTREFVVSLHDEATEKIRQSRDADLDDRRTRLKFQGLDARPAFVARRQAALAAEEKSVGNKAVTNVKSGEKFLQCRVAPSQPTLTLQSPSLLHGHMVVYEGEVTTLKLRLDNDSPLPVDYVRLYFTDDLSDAIQHALSEGDLMQEDAHQLEQGLMRESTFSYSRKPRDIRVASGKSVILPIKFRGKLDCTTASITVEYGHVDAPGRGGLVTEETKSFYTRRSILDFGVTVLAHPECGQLGFATLGLAEARFLEASLLRDGLGGSEDPLVPKVNGFVSSFEDSDTVCALTLDVRNVRQDPVEVSIELDGPEQVNKRVGRLQQVCIIGPAATAHFSIPLSKLSLSFAQLAAPIPSLSSRQFILSKIKLSPQEEKNVRRRFWYKQEILSRLRGHWRNVRDGHHGRLAGLEEAIDLDDSQFSILTIPAIDLDLSLTSAGAGTSRPAKRATPATTTIVAPQSFCNITSTVEHRASRPLKLLYRLVPLPAVSLDLTSSEGTAAVAAAVAAASAGGARRPSVGNGPLSAAGHHSNDPILSRMLITDGGLSCPVEPWPLPPGQKSKALTTGVTFLAEGTFAFIACVEEEGQELQGDDGSTEVFTAAERFSQVSREALFVEVRAPGSEQ